MLVAHGYATVLKLDMLVMLDPWDSSHHWRAYKDYRNGAGGLPPGELYYRVALEKGQPVCEGEAGTAHTPTLKLNAQAPALTKPLEILRGASRPDTFRNAARMLKGLAITNPELFGFSGQDEASQATMKICTDETVEGWGPKTSALPEYFRILVNRHDAGVFGMLHKKDRYRVYSFDMNGKDPNFAAAREALARLGVDKATLVYVSQHNQYLMKTLDNKQFFPVGPLDGLSPDKLYTKDEIQRVLKPLDPRTPTGPKRMDR